MKFKLVLSFVCLAVGALAAKDPYALWFGFGLRGGRVNDPVMGNRIDGHRLLRQSRSLLNNGKTTVGSSLDLRVPKRFETQIFYPLCVFRYVLTDSAHTSG